MANGTESQTSSYIVTLKVDDTGCSRIKNKLDQAPIGARDKVTLTFSSEPGDPIEVDITGEIIIKDAELRTLLEKAFADPNGSVNVECFGGSQSNTMCPCVVPPLEQIEYR